QNFRRSESLSTRYAGGRHSTWQDPKRKYNTIGQSAARRQDVTEGEHGIADLIVAQVRRRAKPQDIAPRIRVDGSLAQRSDNLRRTLCMDREEPTTALGRDPFDTGNRRVDVEAVERRAKEIDLPEVDLAQALSRQALLLLKLKNRRAPVVRRRIVGRTRECSRGFGVRHARGPRALERIELRKPAGQNRTPACTRRYAQKAVALPELTILVAASGDE